VPFRARASIDQGGVVAGVEPVDVGWILLGVCVWAFVVGATVIEGVGAAVDERGEGEAGVVTGWEGSVLVVLSVGRKLGVVGLLVTGLGLLVTRVGVEGMVATVTGRTWK